MVAGKERGKGRREGWAGTVVELGTLGLGLVKPFVVWVRLHPPTPPLPVPSPHPFPRSLHPPLTYKPTLTGVVSFLPSLLYWYSSPRLPLSPLPSSLSPAKRSFPQTSSSVRASTFRAGKTRSAENYYRRSSNSRRNLLQQITTERKLSPERVSESFGEEI